MIDYTPKRINHFWNKVNKDGSIPAHCPELGQCWEWTAFRLKKGYGIFHPSAKVKELAHRLSWKLTYGDINNNLQVLHKCDNPSCVNPNHLFLGTHQENMDDMVNKDRHNKGERNAAHVLTWDIVRQIRSLYKGEYGTQAKLAKQFNVSRATLNMIIHNKYWIE